MNDFRQRIKKFNERRKRQIVQNFFSSFVITAVVVVAVVIMAPKPAFARFMSLDVVGTDVYYQVEVIDEEYMLVEGSLKIVASSQIDNQEMSLTYGVTHGSFVSLRPNIEYTISVMGTGNYGSFALTRQKVKTSENYGALILQAQFLPNSFQEEFLDCEVVVAFSNLKNEVKQFNLYYALFSEEESIPQPMAYGSEEVPYESITLNQSPVALLLGPFPKVNGYVHVVVEAILQNDESIILDEREVALPFAINAYLYLESVGQHSIQAVMYPDSYLSDIIYKIRLVKDGVIISEVVPTYVLLEENYYMGEVEFTDLSELSVYSLVMVAEYIHPLTKEARVDVLQTETLMTLPYHEVHISHLDMGYAYEIDIRLVDPSQMFVNVRIVIISITDDIQMYRGETPVNGQYVDNEWTAYHYMEVPQYEHYLIQVVADKQVPDGPLYHYNILYQITK